MEFCWVDHQILVVSNIRKHHLEFSPKNGFKNARLKILGITMRSLIVKILGSEDFFFTLLVLTSVYNRFSFFFCNKTVTINGYIKSRAFAFLLKCVVHDEFKLLQMLKKIFLTCCSKVRF